MTQAKLKAAKAELKRLNKFIEKHEGPKSQGYTITENKANTEEYGERYVFVKIAKDDLESRKALKAIRYGKMNRGKARWNKDAVAWSIVASALEGTRFAL